VFGHTAQRACPEQRGELGACAAGHPAEVDAGIRILKAGGNAVDAVVAAAFAAFVVEQLDCGLGGFARITVWLEKEQRFVAFDGYVRAPMAAHESMFELAGADLDYYGHPPTVGERARYGPLAVAVPGAVAALCEAQRRCGRRALQELVEPAIELADAGVAFGWREQLAIAQLEQHLRRLPETARQLLPGGTLPHIAVQLDDATRMDTSALAGTLRRIAERGAAGFYTGPTAQALSSFLADRGGILAVSDLESYRARVFDERPHRFRDCRYASCGDHVSYLGLGIVDGLALGGPDDASYRHYMAEALGVAFTDVLCHYGDPEFVVAPVEGLASEGFARARCRDLSAESALSRPIRAGNPWPFDSRQAPCEVPGGPGPASRGGTTQMVAADRHGNIASVITAVGWNYGSLIYEPDSGIFLNNGMLYFDPRPGRPASIAPGKRPLFGAPVVAAVDDEHRYAIAGSGGYRIESGVLHTLVNQVAHGMSVEQAIEHPRVHCQGRQTFIDARIDSEVQRALRERGHDLVVLPEDASTLHFGRVAAITRDHDSGVLSASSGPQWMSAAAAF
jgi:gamma-glutamyltranspeptidase/glutathione hydrolase